mmetsp:Transcript_3638/g.10722  ORF Transcript_3638/g.10722 Transcript_3638/m.10722 type:complete len:643 (-) Transcript_3638:113-2041(-)
MAAENWDAVLDEHLAAGEDPRRTAFDDACERKNIPPGPQREAIWEKYGAAPAPGPRLPAPPLAAPPAQHGLVGGTRPGAPPQFGSFFGFQRPVATKFGGAVRRKKSGGGGPTKTRVLTTHIFVDARNMKFVKVEIAHAQGVGAPKQFAGSCVSALDLKYSRHAELQVGVPSHELVISVCSSLGLEAGLVGLGLEGQERLAVSPVRAHQLFIDATLDLKSSAAEDANGFAKFMLGNLAPCMNKEYFDLAGAEVLVLFTKNPTKAAREYALERSHTGFLINSLNVMDPVGPDFAEAYDSGMTHAVVVLQLPTQAFMPLIHAPGDDREHLEVYYPEGPKFIRRIDAAKVVPVDTSSAQHCFSSAYSATSSGFGDDDSSIHYGGPFDGPPQPRGGALKRAPEGRAARTPQAVKVVKLEPKEVDLVAELELHKKRSAEIEAKLKEREEQQRQAEEQQRQAAAARGPPRPRDIDDELFAPDIDLEDEVKDYDELIDMYASRYSKYPLRICLRKYREAWVTDNDDEPMGEGVWGTRGAEVFNDKFVDDEDIAHRVEGLQAAASSAGATKVGDVYKWLLEQSGGKAFDYAEPSRPTKATNLEHFTALATYEERMFLLAKDIAMLIHPALHVPTAPLTPNLVKAEPDDDDA